MHTVQRFADALPQSRIVVVLPSSHIEYWDKLCRRHGFAVPHIVCTGGANRFESVSNGLRHAGEAELIAVHDGVRPLVSREIIERATEDARTYGAVIPVVRPIDSMRRIDRDGSRIVEPEPLPDRSDPPSIPCRHPAERVRPTVRRTVHRRCERRRSRRTTGLPMRGLVRKHQDHDAGRYADGRGPARPKTADVRHSRRITRRQTHPRNFSPAKGTPAENLTGPGASRCSARLRTDKKRILPDKYGYGRETFRQLRKSRQFPENRKESEGLFPIRFQAGDKAKDHPATIRETARRQDGHAA